MSIVFRIEFYQENKEERKKFIINGVQLYRLSSSIKQYSGIKLFINIYYQQKKRLLYNKKVTFYSL